MKVTGCNCFTVINYCNVFKFQFPNCTTLLKSRESKIFNYLIGVLV